MPHSIAYRKRLVAAAALATLVPLGLAACSGSKDGGGSSGSVDSLTVLDYYSDEPAKTQVGDMLTACGASIGVAKIDHQSVPGPTLIQKVLQQASSKTLPDVLMLDNPDIQQIAATGALAPLNDLGLNADGVIKGMVDATSYQGKLYGPAPVTNTIALFYNKDMLAEASIQPPKTWHGP